MAKKDDIFQALTENIKTAVPFYKDGTVIVDVSLDSCNDFFFSLYSSVVSYVHPNSIVVPPDLISAEDFTLICRYFLKVRLDFVYARALGSRTTNRTNIPGVHLPQSMFRMLRSIGVVQIFKGNVKVVPKTKEVLEDEFAVLKTSPKLFNRFSSLVEAYPNRRWSSASPSINDTEVGTAFWILSVRDVENRTLLAKNRHSVVVLAAFPDWSPQDAVLAGIVQNGFDGTIADYGIIYKSSSIKDALLLRQQFHLNATV